MFKIKILLLLGLLGYLGFIGWNRFMGENEGGFLNRSSEPELSPLEQHHVDLQRISTRIFSSLTDQNQDESERLKRVWTQAQSDFKAGELGDADAKVLASLIRELDEMSKERLLYADRVTRIDQYKDVDFKTTRDLEERKTFAREQLKRQWEEWVAINRAKLDPLFASLSE